MSLIVRECSRVLISESERTVRGIVTGKSGWSFVFLGDCCFRVDWRQTC